MIHLGASRTDKPSIIREFLDSRGLTKCKIIGPNEFSFPSPYELIDWSQIIKYKTFYRLLQEIDSDTLIVVNECLRTTNRSDLTYNCLRHYLANTRHVIVFQWLPILESIQDVMILVDLATQSRWKGCGLANADISNVPFSITDRTPQWTARLRPASEDLQRLYAQSRKKQFDNLGSDLHSIPRTLHLLGGKERVELVPPSEPVVARNARLKLANCITYGTVDSKHRVVVDFPHSVKDMADFLAHAEQTKVACVVTDLKVDQWYLRRYESWSKEISGAYSEIQQRIRG